MFFIFSFTFSRDTLIEQLLREINELKSRLSQLRAEDDRIINALRERIAKLERDLEELQQIAAQACEENVALKKEVEEASTHGEAVVKLVEAESKSHWFLLGWEDHNSANGDNDDDGIDHDDDFKPGNDISIVIITIIIA